MSVPALVPSIGKEFDVAIVKNQWFSPRHASKTKSPADV